MRKELLDLANDLARRGEPFALATVVARRPPISAHVGDMALVTRDGGFHGWVGGSCTRPTVVAEAQRSLADGRPRLVVLDPEPAQAGRPGAVVFPMTCHSGGSVEIHVQPVLPPPVLLIYGLSPTARALARLAKAMGHSVHAIDPAADASAFPGADTISADPQALSLGKPAAPVAAVVATQGEWDEAAIVAALQHGPDYLGVVASPKRYAEMKGALAQKASPDAIARIANPAGLDLGAHTPEEVALSILAEIVKRRRAAAARPAAVEPEQAPAQEALDPVCGMTVRVDGARHRARHQGSDFYFCCAGCRERFLATPERYLQQAAAKP